MSPFSVATSAYVILGTVLGVLTYKYNVLWYNHLLISRILFTV